MLGRIEPSPQGKHAVVLRIQGRGVVQKRRGFVELPSIEHGLCGIELDLDIPRRSACRCAIIARGRLGVAGQGVGISQFRQRALIFRGNSSRMRIAASYCPVSR